jgi:hypothetical protein
MTSIAAIRDLAQTQYGHVSTRQLSARGVPTHVVRHAVETGALRRVTRQVLQIAGTPEVEGTLAMVAVLDAPDGAVLSHTSAAALWGLPGFRLDRDLHVTVPARGQPRRRRTARVHYHLGLPPDQLVLFRGIPTTSPSLTIFHLAAICAPGRVERALDRAWSDQLVSGPSLTSLLERLAASGRNGITTMRELLAERGPDYIPPASGLEARFKQIIDTAPGIPSMRRQVDLGGEHWVGRVDFVWDDLPGGVEVQSERHHAALIDQRSDAMRLDRGVGRGRVSPSVGGGGSGPGVATQAGKSRFVAQERRIGSLLCDKTGFGARRSGQPAICRRT